VQSLLDSYIKDDVQVSGKDMGYTMPCCSHGDKGEDVKGYDCISIPGAEKTDGSDIKVSKVCGHKAGLVTMNGVMSAMGDAMGHKTICNGRAPFSVRFTSDHWESTEDMGDGKVENPAIQKGFQLTYKLQACT